MRQLTIFLALIIAISTSALAQPATFFDQADQFFKQNVENGKVNYAKLSNDQDLNDLITAINTFDLEQVTEGNRKAYLINVYNLLVIKGALDNYPLNSVLNVNGFFDAKKHNVGGQKMTLNQLEKDELLKVYKDARLHFVLVCGALDCPPITTFA
ncbi:MAG: DUF547 domain-containing protein, partial [Bacteroidota bacterium]